MARSKTRARAIREAVTAPALGFRTYADDTPRDLRAAPRLDEAWPDPEAVDFDVAPAASYFVDPEAVDWEAPAETPAAPAEHRQAPARHGGATPWAALAICGVAAVAVAAAWGVNLARRSPASPPPARVAEAAPAAPPAALPEASPPVAAAAPPPAVSPPAAPPTATPPNTAPQRVEIARAQAPPPQPLPLRLRPLPPPAGAPPRGLARAQVPAARAPAGPTIPMLLAQAAAGARSAESAGQTAASAEPQRPAAPAPAPPPAPVQVAEAAPPPVAARPPPILPRPLDCAAIRSAAQDIVCRDAGLVAADRRMVRAYAAALAAGAPEDALREDQDDWRRIREVAARRSKQAVENIYHQRIGELEAMASRP